MRADWLIDYITAADGGLQVLIGNRELVQDSGHYDELLEREPHALEIFADQIRTGLASFEVPQPEDFLSNFGVEPVQLNSSDTTYAVELDGGSGDTITWRWDLSQQSASLIWVRDRLTLLEVSRARAYRLSIFSGDGESGFHLDYKSDGQIHRVLVRAYPTILVSDNQSFGA